MPPDRPQATLGVDGVQERQLARLVARVGNRKNVVLELDETGVTLCVWYWPHRNSHQFRGPYCLCGFIDDCDPGHYEAAIVVSTRGPNAGEYVACCASSKCGYVVLIEQMYNSPGLPTKRYARRGSDQARPREVVFLDGNDVKPVDVIQRRQDSSNQTHTTFDRLLKLDSFTRPGLTETEFRNFLTKCWGCECLSGMIVWEKWAEGGLRRQARGTQNTTGNTKANVSFVKPVSVILLTEDGSCKSASWEVGGEGYAPCSGSCETFLRQAKKLVGWVLSANPGKTSHELP
ncbi:hypothetical protein EDD22DRAFT_848115 [Suillus occidentalis]|nr:hypothetical protein EDD22DRAFT_848115 [Suillus occidentalis]